MACLLERNKQQIPKTLKFLTKVVDSASHTHKIIFLIAETKQPIESYLKGGIVIWLTVRGTTVHHGG